MIVLSPFVTSFCHKVVWPFQNSHQSNLIQTSELLFTRNPITLSLGMERLLELMTELPPPQKERRKDFFPPEVSGSAVWFQGLRFNTKAIYCIYWMTHQDKNVGKGALRWHSMAVLLSPHGAVVCSWERGQVAPTGLKWGQHHLYSLSAHLGRACDFLRLKCTLLWSPCFLKYVEISLCEINLLALNF